MLARWAWLKERVCRVCCMRKAFLVYEDTSVAYYECPGGCAFREPQR